MHVSCRCEHAGRPPHAVERRREWSTLSPDDGVSISLHPASTLQPRPQPHQVLHAAVARLSLAFSHAHTRSHTPDCKSTEMTACLENLPCCKCHTKRLKPSVLWAKICLLHSWFEKHCNVFSMSLWCRFYKTWYYRGFHDWGAIYVKYKSEFCFAYKCISKKKGHSLS